MITKITRTEIVFPKLPNGLYLIKADTNSKENVFAAAHVQVSDLAIIESDENDRHIFQLIDRNNGQPIIGANIKLSYTENRNKSSTKNFTTDRNGKFQFEKDETRYRNIEVKATYKDDTAYFGDYYINRKYEEDTTNDIEYRNFLFTDRSIYRPGQTVYFKGIAIKTTNRKTEVIQNKLQK